MTEIMENANTPGRAHMLGAKQCFEEFDGTLGELNWDGDGEFRGLTHEVTDSEHDNNRRAGFAVHMLEAYVANVRGIEPDSVFSDMLGDLMHLADAVGVDFDEELEKARTHYDAEGEGSL